MRHEQPYGWRFIDLAEPGINTGRSYAAALLRIVLYPLAASVLFGLGVGLAAVVNGHRPATSGPIVALVAQYGLIVIAGAALLHAVVRVHRRPALSLVTPEPQLDWRRLLIGLAVELAILGGQLALVHALTGWPWRFEMALGVPALVLGLVLIPLQAASEELLFRGYLTQVLGRVVRSRITIALAVGVIFGALHLNAYGWLTLPYFLVVSLTFSLVSLRDERLELAIGGHSGMNLFAFGAAQSAVLRPSALGGMAAAMQFNGAAIAVMVINVRCFTASRGFWSGCSAGRSERRWDALGVGDHHRVYRRRDCAVDYPGARRLPRDDDPRNRRRRVRDLAGPGGRLVRALGGRAFHRRDRRRSADPGDLPRRAGAARAMSANARRCRAAKFRLLPAFGDRPERCDRRHLGPMGALRCNRRGGKHHL
jgi:hypothetical protein